MADLATRIEHRIDAGDLDWLVHGENLMMVSSIWHEK
jgi:hypothetical protein